MPHFEDHRAGLKTMSKRYVIVYWLLLLIPTILISAALFHVLRHEQKRMLQMAHSSAKDRALTIAETICLTTAGVESTLTQALLLLPPDNLEELLVGMAKTTDLVRNVFVWTPQLGLQYPLHGIASAQEEDRFLERYGALFSHSPPWQMTDPERPRTSPAGTAPFDQQPQRDPADLEQRTPCVLPKMGHEEPPPLGVVGFQPGRGLAHEYMDSVAASEPFPKTISGWFPTLHDNDPSIVGWVQRTPSDPVYGVELHMPKLLSWLIIYFPDAGPKGVEYALVAESGYILHRTGTIPPSLQSHPDLSVPLAPYLPQMQIAMHVVNPLLMEESSRSFFLLSVLLLVIFVTAVFLGGSLLIWQATRNMTYAQQKTSFVSNVSHELKTPLTSIRMYAELLREERVKDPTRKERYLQVIVAESQRLTRLVNNVLDFGRLEQGKKKYHFVEIDLTRYLHDIVETQRLRFQKAGMELNNEILQDDSVVQVDPDALEQVLLNLMDNAMKYASQGKEVTVDLRDQGEYLELRVNDRGPGVPRKHQARIFEKFHRVDDSLTSQKPGSGLGLSIARSIMREMKGDVIFEDRPGGGSSFVVFIPCLQKGKAPSPQQGARSA